MIIRCPECTTGFNLPDERITPKGTKLKCSKCSHVFRVRADDAGEPEIYYKSTDNQGSGQGATAAASGGESKSGSGAGLGLKPKKSSAFGDIDEGKDEEMGAFESAFEQKPEPAATASAGSTANATGSSDREDEGDATVVMDKSELEQKHEASADPEPTAQGSQPNVEHESAQQQPVQGSGSSFGDPSDHVDPSFGQDGPVFDPEQGKVEQGNSNQQAQAGVGNQASSPTASSGPPAGAKGPPPTAAGPPSAASGPPPTAQKMAQPQGGTQGGAQSPKGGAKSAGPKNAAVLTGDWDVDDLAAHKIGGNMKVKALVVALLASFVGMAFLGVVAHRNDGFIDFRAFSQMIKVAFADGEYEPRSDWVIETGDTIIVEPSDPVTVEGVHGELVAVGQGDHIFVVQGFLRNHDDVRVRDVELRGMLTTMEGRTMREIAAMAGDDAPIGEFRNLRGLDGLDELLGDGGGAIEPGGLQPFTMVFEDLPERVLEGEHYSFRVEVANMRGGSGDS